MDFGAGETDGGELKVGVGLRKTLVLKQAVIAGIRKVFHTTLSIFGVTENIGRVSKKTFKGSPAIF